MTRYASVEVSLGDEPAKRNEDRQGGLDSGPFAQHADVRVVADAWRHPLVRGELEVDEELEPSYTGTVPFVLDEEVGVIHGEEDDEPSQMRGARAKGLGQAGVRGP